MSSVHLAQIIPLVRLPADKHFFSYAIDDDQNIQPGMLVTIPFRRRKTIGLVASIKYNSPKPSYRLSSISTTLHPEPLLQKSDLELILLLARAHHVSATVIAKMFLPPLQKRMISKLTFDSSIGQKKSMRSYVLINSKSELSKLWESLPTDLSVLIIVPTRRDAQLLQQSIPHSNVQLFTSDNGVAAQRNVWESMKQAKPVWTIATRQGCFLPLDHVQTIVVWNTQDEHHKSWEATPYYRATDIIRTRAQCSVIEAGHTMTMDQLVGLQSGELQKLFPINPTLHPYTFINLQDQMREKNYSFITPAFEKAIKDGKKILILHNRKGFSNRVKCIDCDYSFVCTTCSNPLVVRNDGRMHCKIIIHANSEYTQCPKCNSLKFKLAAKGTESLALELSRAYPQLRIATHQSGVPLDTKEQYDCVVSTDAAFSSVDLEYFDVIVLPYADRFVTRPWHNALAEGMYFFRQLRFLCRTDAEIIIQTFSRDHLLWYALTSVDYLRKWYAQEILTREKYHYPPFGVLIRITAFAPSPTATTLLQNALPTNAKLYTELPEVIKNGTKQVVFLARIAHNNWIEVTAKIAEQLPPTWHVDPHPESH